VSDSRNSEHVGRPSHARQQAGAPERSAEAVALLRTGWSEVELLDRLHSGDRRAGTELYDRAATDVNRLVRRVMGLDREHDDLVQQVFANIFANVGQVRDPAALRSWIASVTIKTVRQEIRRRKVRRIVETRPHTSDLATVDPKPEARDLLQRVYVLLDRLPTEQRIVFVLRHVDDRSLADIATMCGVSLATVKRRLARARSRVQFHIARSPELVSELHQYGSLSVRGEGP
jgi:RNA polymerase sigma-70 factor (ECF subfamily)